MSERQIAAVREAILQTFQNPTADPVASVFVLGAILIIVLMVVLGLLLLITPRRRKVVKIRRYVQRPVSAEAGADIESTGQGLSEEAVVEGAAEASVSSADTADKEPEPDSPGPENEASGKGKASRFTRPVAPVWLTKAVSVLVSVPVLLLLAFASAYVVTGTDQYCARTCHSSQDSVRQAFEAGHAPCVECHETPGVPGLFANTASRSRMAVAAVMDREPGGPVTVASSSCSQCHESVLTGTQTSSRGLRMSHAEPQAAGIACTECHKGTGHSKRRDYSMSTCLTCHDAKQTSADCSVCHTGDPYALRPAGSDDSEESTQTMGSGDVLYPAVFVSETSCAGCHDEKRECDSCHGIRMPHTPDYRTTGAHARDAAFEKKQLCFQKCHTEDGCASGCHVNNFNAHGPNWKVVHARSSWDSGCVCHSGRSGRTEPMCVLCHDR